jgi:hypothetical protein
VKDRDLAPVESISVADPNLIEDLERLLADVKSGYVSSILAVWGTASGGMTGRLQSIGGRDAILSLLGEATMMQQNLIDELKAVNEGEA